MIQPLLVINAAALSPALVKRSDLTPNLSDLIAQGHFLPLDPVFPAVTCPVQASLTTGLYPSEHGIIANGLFERDAFEVHFWHQTQQLFAKGKRFWTPLRKEIPDLKVAMLWWQHSKYSDDEFINTPAPIHTEAGEVISTCYSKPALLYDELGKRFGPFPLHHYWGPMASIESSQWIVKATKHILEKHRPTLTLTYLPHMDYVLQRIGLKGAAVEQDLKGVDALVGELSSAAKKMGGRVVVLSEYGMSAVTGSIDINRELRKAGFLAVREIRGREYAELGDGAAFAVVDHQVAHVYVFKKERLQEVRRFLEKQLRLEVLGTEEEKREFHIDHERSGDLIAIAPPDKWFSYHWWFDNAKAPTFARTVDIHRKPGYDPLDLCFSEDRKGISMNTELIKGSHGRLPSHEDEKGVFITDTPTASLKNARSINAVDVPAVLTELLTSRG